MAAYISFFNRVRSGALREGININGVIHKASPVKQGNDWAKGTCPKCGSKNGFVFRSHMDGKVYILFCQRCGKYSWKKADGPKGDSSAAGKSRCQAITKSGNRCKMTVTEGCLCGNHNAMVLEGKTVDIVKDVNSSESTF